MSISDAPAITRSTKKHIDSRVVSTPQKPAIEMPPLGEEVERDSNIAVSETPLPANALERLAFNEDPITMMIHRSSEKFSPRCTDLISINGVKAEMLFKNGWIQIGYLPRGIAFTTKRKYVEALALSRHDHVNTVVTETPGQDPHNTVERITTATASFTIIEDKNPRGSDWIRGLLNQSAL